MYQKYQVYIISGHDKEVLHTKPNTKGCNCSDKKTCPLDNKCLRQKVIYQADFTSDTDDSYRYYLELAETSFKDRYNNHKCSFHNKQQKKNSTELSKYVWSLINGKKLQSSIGKFLK